MARNTEIAATRAALAEHFQLSEDDRTERIPSGRVTYLQNLVGWAATYLFRAGLLERPRRAHYRITERGRKVLDQHPELVNLSVLRQFGEFVEFLSGTGSGSSKNSQKRSVPPSSTTAEVAGGRAVRFLQLNRHVVRATRAPHRHRFAQCRGSAASTGLPSPCTTASMGSLISMLGTEGARHLSPSQPWR
jgi:restriction endonuclease Mrr